MAGDGDDGATMSLARRESVIEQTDMAVAVRQVARSIPRIIRGNLKMLVCAPFIAVLSQ
jgi:hypothetical protein